MNPKALLFVANWKMNMPFTAARQFIHTHLSALELLAQKTTAQFIICPSFIALSDLCIQTGTTSVKIGAQDCSAYASGAHTGEIDAQSIAESGCTHTLIGHSERRYSLNESNEIIGTKITRLRENNIIPIVCIGETYTEYTNNTTLNTLQQQLEPIFSHSKHIAKLIIAYEPVWAIGTGTIPDIEYLNKIFSWIERTTTKTLSTTQLIFLYGGSVSEANAASLMRIQHINGFLIGNASLDFQKFQNIVLSSHDTVSTIK